MHAGVSEQPSEQRQCHEEGWRRTTARSTNSSTPGCGGPHRVPAASNRTPDVTIVNACESQWHHPCQHPYVRKLGLCGLMIPFAWRKRLKVREHGWYLGRGRLAQSLAVGLGHSADLRASGPHIYSLDRHITQPMSVPDIAHNELHKQPLAPLSVPNTPSHS
eukprot:107-Rhodomonas_salina.1